ncbi:sulfur carrier protein [Aequitasia blattaphilus]|uniref:Sulfur carrier protein ThiS n=1 Tax=Aequitasia blattaphilus TaxID=2949332 RepID=A0ABT1ECI6_9FIRM|nr:sulfur carrier protein ThiS [Aequitasia blattaphilus]MCP1102187.1 sulfur carrier protein ThiS [Aequitasia blattaphilus]MCR8614827.1 sulfur carrier protein ThiS [Aequitasia blattaphilus]
MNKVAVSINGNHCIVSGNITVLDMLLSNQYDVTKLAVEKNGQILPKAQFSSEIVQDGDVYEVVTFVGGG